HRGLRDHGGRLLQVRPDEHASFAALRLGNASDATVSNRTAKKSHFALARQDHVGDVTAPPSHEARILLALDPRSDTLAGDFHHSVPLLNTEPATRRQRCCADVRMMSSERAPGISDLFIAEPRVRGNRFPRATVDFGGAD